MTYIAYLGFPGIGCRRPSLTSSAADFSDFHLALISSRRRSSSVQTSSPDSSTGMSLAAGRPRYVIRYWTLSSRTARRISLVLLFNSRIPTWGVRKPPWEDVVTSVVTLYHACDGRSSRDGEARLLVVQPVLRATRPAMIAFPGSILDGSRRTTLLSGMFLRTREER